MLYAKLCALHRLRKAQSVLTRSSLNSVVVLRPYVQGRASSTTSFCCSVCHERYAKWQGQCTACDSWGKITRAAPLTEMMGFASGYRQPNGTASKNWIKSSEEAEKRRAIRMADIVASDDALSEHRLSLENSELNWVLSGGIVRGSLILLSGSPGIGKSTLALQMASMLSSSPSHSGDNSRNVLYVSGEETTSQVKVRFERLGLDKAHVYVANETNVDEIMRLLHRREEQAGDTSYPFAGLVIDSIQTMFAADIASVSGTVSQVKECTLRFLRFAKDQNVPVILIGHVTKSGDIAGPKILEHIVDTVIHLEGDAHSSRRFLKCTKNRFGSTSEVGVFDMSERGLTCLTNPLLAFLSSDGLSSESDTINCDGTSLTIAMEGSRPVPIEIQALVSKASYTSSTTTFQPSRVRAMGVSFDKLHLLLAVLERRAKVNLQNRNIFVNIAEGFTIQEPAADLALAIAIVSAYSGQIIPPRGLLLGEIALSGSLRSVGMLPSRLIAASKIGIEWCIVPKKQWNDTKNKLKTFQTSLKIYPISSIIEAIDVVFKNQTQQKK